MPKWKKFFDENNEKNDEIKEKKKFSLKSWFTENDNFDEDAFEEKYFEIEDEIDLNKTESHKASKRTSVFKKIKNIFTKSNNNYEDYLEQFNEENNTEPENYKTYLEKQKQEKKKEIEDANLNIDFDIEYTEDFSNYKEKQNILTKLKNKFRTNNDVEKISDTDLLKNEDTTEKETLLNKFKNKFRTNNDVKEISDTDLLEDENNAENKSFLNNLKNKFQSLTKINEEDEKEYNYEDNFVEDNENIEIAEKLEEFKENKENSIIDKLNSMGIKTSKIEDVNIFDKKENKRTHPTLASMKVKRILQEKNIDNLTTNLVFNDDNQAFKNSIKKRDEDNIEKQVNIQKKTSKNQKEIEKLQNDFNKINRKGENISENYLKDTAKEEFKNSLNNIEKQTNIAKQEYEKHEIQINEQDKKNRREKLKYTTINDVLKENEKFLEDDIDRVSKLLNVEKNIPNQPEEINNFKENIQNKNIKLNNQSTLDTLINEATINPSIIDNTTNEINKLEENIKVIKLENNNNDEKIQNENEINKTSLEQYTDYNLDIEEINELTALRNIESKSKETNIDKVNKKNQINEDNNKFIEAKTSTPTNNNIDNNNKIEYTEKLYTNDVKEYFLYDDSPLTFGEYKTRDYGYRPVSREKIESNQRKLEKIFDKYSSINISKNSNNKFIEQKINTPTKKNVGKFKPSVVYSSVYGTNLKNVNREEIKQKNLFKEIATQEEAVWNIKLNNKIKTKK